MTKSTPQVQRRSLIGKQGESLDMIREAFTLVQKPQSYPHKAIVQIDIKLFNPTFKTF